MQQFSRLGWVGALAITLLSCSVTRKTVASSAADTLLQDTAVRQAHIGISIYDVATGKYLYNYQGDKYFIPASNTKLFTCYAAMKHLGDSLPGMQYWQDDTAVWLQPTGDPTFLQPEFKNQPVLHFLQQQKKPLYLLSGNWRTTALGYGWAWDDYNDDYAAERSPFPIHGNVAQYRLGSISNTGAIQWQIQPDYFTTQIDNNLPLPGLLAKAGSVKDSVKKQLMLKRFLLRRKQANNTILFEQANNFFATATIPFYTDTNNTALAVLARDYQLNIKKGKWGIDESLRPALPAHPNIVTIKSQATDSMLKRMMHRSDNLYAEQVLLMISQQQLGYMSTSDIVDTLLKTNLKGLVHQPKWVDGSGLSRYNLATPQSFVQVLQKLKAEFGMERLTTILPTGGEGTITNYYQSLQGLIFVKTGTLSNNCALSGYLLTKKGKWLIFSVLANSYPSGAAPVRRAVERFLMDIQRQY